MSAHDPDPAAPQRSSETGHGEDGPPSQAPLFRIDPKMIVLLVVGLIAALLIFWFEPSYTLRYVVVGVLGAIYVFLRFNDWR